MPTSIWNKTGHAVPAGLSRRDLFREDQLDHGGWLIARRLIEVETHRAVFTWVLQLIAKAGLLKGGTIGVDATTLEANAALRFNRAAGERRELRRVLNATGQRVRDRDTNPRAIGEAR